MRWLLLWCGVDDGDHAGADNVQAQVAAGHRPLVFGVVIGWITYRTLRRREGAAVMSDIATVIGAVGGAGVVTLFDQKTLFGWYAIGLAVGFFGYFFVGMWASRKEGVSTWNQWMGD